MKFSLDLRAAVWTVGAVLIGAELAFVLWPLISDACFPR